MADYYLEPWDSNQKENKQKVYVSDNKTIYKYRRKYGNNKAVFYADNSFWTKRRMYIFIGPFLEKAILSYAEICAKCTPSSVKEAFINCPNILAWFKDVLKEKRNGVIVELQLPDGRIFCIQGRYDALFGSKKSTFMKLCRQAEILRTELSLINKSALKVQKSFGQKICSFFMKNLKYIVRGGAIIAASMIGTNIDLPDFDFDVETPDFDVDFGDGLVIDSFDMNSELGVDNYSDAMLGNDIDVSFEENMNIDSNINDGTYSPAFTGQTPPNSKCDGYIYDASIKYNGAKVYRKYSKLWIWNNGWIDVTKFVNLK